MKHYKQIVKADLHKTLYKVSFKRVLVLPLSRLQIGLQGSYIIHSALSSVKIIEYFVSSTVLSTLHVLI